jgi:hypothetical protein
MTSIFIRFEDIRKLGQGYEQRIGAPDACASALGLLVVGFSWLEKSLADHIGELAQLAAYVAPALTAEMSFKQRVAALSSLVRLSPPLRNYNTGHESTEAVWSDISSMLFKAEELRNTIVHSEWLLPNAKSMRRTKTTAKAAKGIRTVIEEYDAGHILDVYDYVLNVMYILDEFFLDCSTSTNGNAQELTKAQQRGANPPPPAALEGGSR